MVTRSLKGLNTTKNTTAMQLSSSMLAMAVESTDLLGNFIMNELSYELQMMNDCGDFGKALEDLPNRAKELEDEVVALRKTITRFMANHRDCDTSVLMRDTMDRALAYNGVKLRTELIEGKYLLTNCI